MTHQDFERYATQKQFGGTMPATWSGVARELIARVGRPSSEVTFLDIGCGDGRSFPFMVHEGLAPSNIHGTELSATRVARCRKLGFVNARVLQKGERLPYHDGQFDIVNMMEVIEHVPVAESAALLGEVRRVLRADGYLLLTTPNYPIKRFYDLYAALAYRKWSSLLDDPTHVALYNHRRLSKLLRNYFSVLEQREFKPGFLYKHIKRPFLEHKLCYVCTGVAPLSAAR